MGHRYGGTADGSYRYLIRLINQNDRLSQKKRDELLEGVDFEEELTEHELRERQSWIDHDNDYGHEDLGEDDG